MSSSCFVRFSSSASIACSKRLRARVTTESSPACLASSSSAISVHLPLGEDVEFVLGHGPLATALPVGHLKLLCEGEFAFDFALRVPGQKCLRGSDAHG